MMLGIADRKSSPRGDPFRIFGKAVRSPGAVEGIDGIRFRHELTDRPF
jgi:hypothetical protein